MFGAILLGAALALMWAIPAGFAGGEEYRKAIFWGQSAGRISNSFAHKLPFWWYTALLPVLWLPWTLWPALWRSIKTCHWDTGLRFCTAQGLFVLVAFSLISGKRIHYLLPIFPAFALAVARILSLNQKKLTRRDWLPISLLLAVVGLALLLLPAFGLQSDLAEIAHETPVLAKILLLALGIALLVWHSHDIILGVRSMAWVMVGVMFTAHLAYRQAAWPYYDMQPFANHLAAIERQGATIAHWQEYHGDFNFLGRLQKPLVKIDKPEILRDWLTQHPQDYLVLIRQPDPTLSEDGVEFAQFYRGTRRVMLWKADELSKRPELLSRMMGQ
jgi:4-amino-4-deoxy-L-arabinose transferase-like glycosyltransferase